MALLLTEKADGFEKRRGKWYSDDFLSTVAFLLSVGCCLFSCIACYHGHLRKLGPYDLNADYCGSNSVGADRQYLYYPDPDNPSLPLCVASCPTADAHETINLPDGRGGITVHPLTASTLIQGQYCLQNRLNPKSLLSTLSSQQPLLYSMAQDFFKSTEILFTIIFVSIVVAITSMKAMLNQKISHKVSLIVSLAPGFFAIASVLLMLYHSFMPRIISPGSGGIALGILLAWVSIWTGLLPLLFSSTYARSRHLMLIGFEALMEMPDVLTFVILTAGGLAITIIWDIYICYALMTVGRTFPQYLFLEHHAERYVGFVTAFNRTTWQNFGCLIMLLSFVVQFEAGIALTKFVITRSVRWWFERFPSKNRARHPSCEFLLRALFEFPAFSRPFGAASIFGVFCRPTSLKMQILASEFAVSPFFSDSFLAWIQRSLDYFNDSLLFNNQLLYVKLAEPPQGLQPTGFLEGALGGYMELANKKVDDHYASQKYSLQEMLSPVFKCGFFTTLMLSVTLGSWIFVEVSPTFNGTGLKALDSAPFVVFVCMAIAATIFYVFLEAANAASCAAVHLWTRAAADDTWSDNINSDNLTEYESHHLHEFLGHLRRHSDKKGIQT